MCVGPVVPAVRPGSINVTQLRRDEASPWRQLTDLERLLCWSAGKSVQTLYSSVPVVGGACLVIEVVYRIYSKCHSVFFFKQLGVGGGAVFIRGWHLSDDSI